MKRTEEGFDKTQLTIETELLDGSIHRDYIAHCFRWSHVVKICNKSKYSKSKTILDFGCGRDAQLYNTFASNGGYNKLDHYYGVDLNKASVCDRRTGTRIPRTMYSNTNILDVTADMVPNVNMVTSFEVFEHCPIEFVPKILKHLHELNSDAGEFVYSTPCFNGKAAKNHVNEMTRDYFGWLLEENGYKIVDNYGTYASIRDYKPHLTPTELEMYEKLSDYYDTNVLATMFAPFYPEYARNNLWHCIKRTDNDERLFPTQGNRPIAQWDITT